jgi:hypothetical protein
MPVHTFRDIRLAFLKSHPSYGDDPHKRNFPSTAITPLKEEYAINEDRGRPKRKRNAYQFKYPLMRGYVRLRMRKEQGAQSAMWDPNASLPLNETGEDEAR